MAMDVTPEQKMQMIAEAASASEGIMEPQRPEWMKSDEMEGPETLRRKPVHMFSHGVCIESLFGSTGLSFGRIQADFNRGANTALSQFVDAATLGNCWTFLATQDFDPKGKGDGVEFRPGKINYLTGMAGEDINKVLKELKPEPANQQC
jgi:hypothetical protein